MTPKDKQRNARLYRIYGITLDQYTMLSEGQGHACAICDRIPEEGTNRLSVDHDHSSGRIRGLLCNYCNRYRVGRHRDPDLLRKIANYIEGGTDYYVPKKRRPVKRKPRKTKV